MKRLSNTLTTASAMRPSPLYTGIRTETRGGSSLSPGSETLHGKLINQQSCGGDHHTSRSNHWRRGCQRGVEATTSAVPSSTTEFEEVITAVHQAPTAVEAVTTAAPAPTTAEPAR